MEKDKLEKTGSTSTMDIPLYPKRYSVEVLLHPEDNKRVIVNRKSENMSGWELYGLLNILMKEIERQLLIKPEEEMKID